MTNELIEKLVQLNVLEANYQIQLDINSKALKYIDKLKEKIINLSFDLNFDEREEIIDNVWSEMKDALCLDHRTFGHQLIEEVFKKRGEK